MRTVIGLFENWGQARSSIRDLEASGFGADDVSVVAQGDALAAATNRPEASATAAGAAIGAGFGMLAGMASVVIPGVGIVAAAGPIFATGVLGAFGGGLVGSLVDAGVPDEEARRGVEQIHNGGALVAVRAGDDDTPRAIEILTRHHPVNLRECALLRRSEPNARWGERFDSAAPAHARGNRNDLSRGQTMGDAAMEDSTLAVPPLPVAMAAPDHQPTRDLGAGSHFGAHA